MSETIFGWLLPRDGMDPWAASGACAKELGLTLIRAPICEAAVEDQPVLASRELRDGALSFELEPRSLLDLLDYDPEFWTHSVPARASARVSLLGEWVRRVFRTGSVDCMVLALTDGYSVESVLELDAHEAPAHVIRDVLRESTPCRAYIIRASGAGRDVHPAGVSS